MSRVLAQAVLENKKNERMQLLAIIAATAAFTYFSAYSLPPMPIKSTEEANRALQQVFIGYESEQFSINDTDTLKLIANPVAGSAVAGKPAEKPPTAPAGAFKIELKKPENVTYDAQAPSVDAPDVESIDKPDFGTLD